jgi:hypothetical protein
MTGPRPISMIDEAPVSADGDVVDAPRSSAIGDGEVAHVKKVFQELKKALKTITFNRHRTADWLSYVSQAHAMMSTYLDVHRQLETKLEVSTYVVGDKAVLEDDSHEQNIIYPLWQVGIRLLVFKQGITPEELIKFYLTVVDFKKSDASQDLLTTLWKQDYQCVEWVVVSDFALEDGGGEATEDVEVEVEKVLNFLQDQLRSDTTEGIAFARVSVADLDLKLVQLEQLRQTVVDKPSVSGDAVAQVQAQIGEDERTLLERICTILFDVMTLPATPSELEDIQAALEQLLDGLILEGRFATIDALLGHCDALTTRPDLPSANRELARTCGDRLFMLMHEGQRVRAVGGALNTGRTKDLEGVRRYLVRLGATATLLLIDLLDTLNAPQHRRLVADVICEVGKQGVPVFAKRLQSAPSNLAKDLLYIIDKIDPPNKLELFAPILSHENAVLRMEGLSIVGRNKNERCFKIIQDVFEKHEIPQMRAHAARILAEYPPPMAEPVLMAKAKDPRFDERPDGEKRALIGAVARVESDGARAWVRSLFAEKSKLFGGQKIDDRKIMAISALASVPGMPTLQLLAEVAKNESKLHGKDVVEAARAAAIDMKNRLLGKVEA